jgi:hypothetical protein
MRNKLIILISGCLLAGILVFLTFNYWPLLAKEPSGDSVSSIDALVKNSQKKETLLFTKKVVLGTFPLKDDAISGWKVCNPKKDIQYNDEADFYFIGKRLSSVSICQGTPTGDYFCYSWYGYRKNGTLAYISQDYSTFCAGNVSVVSKVYFDRHGKKIKESIKYYNIETRKLVKKLEDMPDGEPEVYKTSKGILAKFAGDLKGTVPPWTTF